MPKLKIKFKTSNSNNKVNILQIFRKFYYREKNQTE